eukprot:365900-Chlamydomonas_euryale.AAC.6
MERRGQAAVRGHGDGREQLWLLPERCGPQHQRCPACLKMDRTCCSTVPTPRDVPTLNPRACRQFTTAYRLSIATERVAFACAPYVLHSLGSGRSPFPGAHHRAANPARAAPVGQGRGIPLPCARARFRHGRRGRGGRRVPHHSCLLRHYKGSGRPAGALW